MGRMGWERQEGGGLGIGWQLRQETYLQANARRSLRLDPPFLFIVVVVVVVVVMFTTCCSIDGGTRLKLKQRKGVFRTPARRKAPH